MSDRWLEVALFGGNAIIWLWVLYVVLKMHRDTERSHERRSKNR